MKTKTTRILKAHGMLYCDGGESTREYTLDKTQNPKTVREALKIARDFEALCWATVKTITSKENTVVKRLINKPKKDFVWGW